MLYDPPDETTVVIPTLNEAKYVGKAIASLKAQDIVQKAPHRFEFMVIDSGSTDDTKKIVEGMQVPFYSGPTGKLSARDLAFELADGEVVFSADADTVYSPNALNLLLRHFQDGRVVAAHGPMIIEGPPLLRVLSGMQYHWQRWNMLGGNNAIRTEAYFDSGRFDLSINQVDSRAMVTEEELRMHDRLLGLGDVVWERDAVAFTSSRRQMMDDEFFELQRAKGVRFQTDGYPME